MYRCNLKRSGNADWLRGVMSIEMRIRRARNRIRHDLRSARARALVAGLVRAGVIA